MKSEPCAGDAAPVEASPSGSRGAQLNEPTIRRFHTFSIDEQAHSLRQWDQSYVQLSPGRFEGRLMETGFGDIHFFRETTNQVIHERGRARHGYRTFCVPVNMKGSANFCGTSWPSHAFATIGGDEEFDLRTASHLDVIGVSFRADRLAEAAYARGIDPSRLERWLSKSCVASLAGDELARVRRMLLEIVMLLNVNSSLFRNKAARESIEAALYDVFLGLISQTTEITRANHSYGPQKQLVNRAIRMVAEQPNENITVRELCKLLRVSRRTLQLYFENVLQVSPLQYLRAYRLSKVRALIKDNAESILIQEAAARWGFWHLSQFAHDYKKLFGELPSDTIRQSLGLQLIVRSPRPGPGHP